MQDTFITLQTESTAEYKEKGSKFIAFAFPMSDVKQFETRLEELKKEHNKSRHHCYAYKIGMTQDVYRMNDDGEPSGTAGRPIFGQIESFGLTDVGIIVVRYFGGILLGASGLITAYREAARMALESSVKIEKMITQKYKISFEYDKMGEVMSALEKMNQNLLETNFEETANVITEVRLSEEAEFVLQFKSLAGNLYKEEIDENTELENISLEKI